MSEGPHPATSEQLMMGAAREGLKMDRRAATMCLLYGKESRASFDSLKRSVQVLAATRRELSARIPRSDDDADGDAAAAPPPGDVLAERPACFGCATAFLGETLGLLEAMARSPRSRDALVASGLVGELVANNVRRGPPSARGAARRVVCALCRGSARASEALAALVGARVAAAVKHSRDIGDVGCVVADDLSLLAESCAAEEGSSATDDDSAAWAVRVGVAVDALFLALESHRSGEAAPQAVLQRIAAPCLAILSAAIAPEGSSAAPSAALTTTTTTTTTTSGASSATASAAAAVAAAAATVERLFGGDKKASSGDQQQQQSPLSQEDEVAMLLGQRKVLMFGAVHPQSAAKTGVPTSEHKARRRMARMFGAPPDEGSGSGSDSDGDGSGDEKKKSEPSAHSPQKPEDAAASSAAAAPSAEQKAPEKLNERMELLAGKRKQTPPAGKAETRKLWLAEKYAQRWILHALARGVIDSRKERKASPLQTLLEEPWLERLLLCSECEQVREEASKIVLRVAALYPERALPLLDAVCKLLPRAMLLAATKGGDTTIQFFRVLVRLSGSPERRLYLAENGFLDELTRAILVQARRIEAADRVPGNYGNVTQGFALRVAVGLLSMLLGASPGVRARFGRRGLIGPTLEAFLALRGLVSQKAKLTDDSAQALLSVLMSFREAGEADQVLFMRACVSALSGSASGRRAPAFVLEQLCNIVSPPKPEPEYRLNLQKVRTQEEFIRGTMDKNPYSTKEVGPLMRDVKNKICMTLDLSGLIDDDNGMELLVDKQIIKLDLPVARVYDQIWRPAHKDSSPNAPMTVVFRLQGLDGEATEPIIETIPEEPSSATPARDPEEEFKIAAVMADCGGLEAILALLGRVSAAQLVRDRDLVILAFRLLSLCSKLEVNRKHLLQINAVPEAVAKLRQALALLSSPTPSSGAGGASAAVVAHALEEIADAALRFAEPLAVRGGSSSALREEDFMDLLGALAQPVVARTPSLSAGLRSLVPNLAGGNPAFARMLVNHFSPHLNLDVHDSGRAPPASSSALQCFVDICAAAPPPLKSLLVSDLDVTKPLIALVVRKFPAGGSGDGRWDEGLAKPSTTAALRMLLSLTTNHAPTQDLLLAEGAIPVLHELEGVRSKEAGGGVGLIAENIVDAIADSAPAKEAAAACREATKKAKLALARKKREEILRNMGLKQKRIGTGEAAAAAASAEQTGTARAVVVAGSTPSSVETLEEERGLACVICREGYTFRPKDVLGFYTLERPCAPSGVAGSGRGFVCSTTNMAMIHFRCHEDATKAERKKKQPLDEWDAAQLRNQMTRCNNIFPVRGPQVTDDGYAASMERYWGTIGGMISGQLRRGSGDMRLRILMHDLRFTIWRFCAAATDATPSTSPAPSAASASGGGSSSKDAGGRESNLRMCAFMVQMALHMLPSAEMERNLTQFLAMPEAAAGAQQPEGALFFVALSLALTTPSQWIRNKLFLLRRVLAAAIIERPPQVSGSGEDAAPEPAELFRSARPSLLFMSLADRIHSALRRNVADQPSADAPWFNALRAALVADPTAAGDAVGSVLAAFDAVPVRFTQLAEFFADLGVLELVQQSVEPGVAVPADAFAVEMFKTIRQQQKRS